MIYMYHVDVGTAVNRTKSKKKKTHNTYIMSRNLHGKDYKKRLIYLFLNLIIKGVHIGTP